MNRSLFTAAMLILLGSVAQRISYKKGPIRHRRTHRQYAFMPGMHEFIEDGAYVPGSLWAYHNLMTMKSGIEMAEHDGLRVGPKTEEAAAKAMRDMVTYGWGFMQDGQHDALERVLKEATPEEKARVGICDAWDRVTKIPFSPFPLDPNCH